VQQKDRDLGSELGYADYLGALERYRLEDLHRPEVLRMSHIWASPPLRLRACFDGGLVSFLEVRLYV
jgi:hypothetical protein